VNPILKIVFMRAMMGNDEDLDTGAAHCRDYFAHVVVKAAMPPDGRAAPANRP
jgi:hypothetical protein